MSVTKKTLKEFLKWKLANDCRWAIRAVQTVYRFQTSHEKALSETIEHNKVGFSAFHAEVLSSLADQSMVRTLNPRQLALLHRLIPHYWSQLLVVSKSEGKLETLEKQAEQWKAGTQK